MRLAEAKRLSKVRGNREIHPTEIGAFEMRTAEVGVVEICRVKGGPGRLLHSSNGLVPALLSYGASARAGVDGMSDQERLNFEASRFDEQVRQWNAEMAQRQAQFNADTAQRQAQFNTEMALRQAQFNLEARHAHLRVWGIPVLITVLTVLATVGVGSITAHVTNQNAQNALDAQKQQFEQNRALQISQFEMSQKLQKESQDHTLDLEKEKEEITLIRDVYETCRKNAANDNDQRDCIRSYFDFYYANNVIRRNRWDIKLPPRSLGRD
jgi:hypothetical protein